ncbi:hypothetical protein BPNPMPFG_007123 (plasmid) [Mesorhizobium sp. AR07]|uniref:hypothetical protein n=1 Tax=Mesorhizobium sp. AR07 TaxID=2865838 RepID=UPI00215EAFBC|nr:hypothetical protein [Mesorhizobium sp. AR07]UVK48687.1 hypothetical protein BPNPMPFG_007123 [Mesorhizobium sp. AR07]
MKMIQKMGSMPILLTVPAFGVMRPFLASTAVAARLASRCGTGVLIGGDAAVRSDGAAMPCNVLLAGDGCQHVLLRHADRHLQLAVSGARITQPVRLHIDAIWPALQLNTASGLLNASTVSHGPPEARGRRLRFATVRSRGRRIGKSPNR